jgi:hypothetical protein
MKAAPTFLNCANHECSAPFNFRHGRLFRFYQNYSMGNASSENQNCLKHLWLCKQCTEIYTLEYREGIAHLISRARSRPLPANACPEEFPSGEVASLQPAPKLRKRSPRKIRPKKGSTKQTVNLLLDARFLERGSR